MASSTTMPSGYDYEFVEEVPDDYICVICQLPMRKPVQTKCGHRYCKACLDKTLTRNSQCPKDRKPLTAQDIFPDLATERKVHSFQIKCPQQDCDWQGDLSDFEKHESRCGTKIVPCNYQSIGCRSKVQRNDLNEHIENHVQQHLSIAIEKILSLQSQMDELKNQAAIMTTTDEIHYHYIWKIKDFSQQLEKAKQSDRDMCLYTEPFYTHRYGYKLKLLLSPNGKGEGKGTHVSVYLIVMRGKYDSILTWPFDWKIKFILMDQKPHPSKRINVTEWLDIDFYTFPTCFQRPITGENDGWGFYNFVSHDTLATENYVMDSTLLLKLVLDKPKTWTAD